MTLDNRETELWFLSVTNKVPQSLLVIAIPPASERRADSILFVNKINSLL